MNKNSRKEWSPQARQFYRGCGMANILGGIIFALSYILLPVSLDKLGSVVVFLFMLAFTLVAVGMVGLYVRHLGATGGLGFIGFIFALLGLMGMFGFNYLLMGIHPNTQLAVSWFTLHPGPGSASEGVVYLCALFTACFAVGYLLLGWSMFKASLLPLAAILLMMIGVSVFAVSLTGDALNVLRPLGAALFGLALLWLGFALWFDATD